MNTGHSLPRGIWALGFVSLFMDMSSELVHSLLPVFMTTVLGASMLTIGLIEGVESMQVLYAEDRDGDEIADGWVKARAWLQERNIRAVKVAFLLSTEQAVDRAASNQVNLLDETITIPADGHLRRVRSLTTAIRGRLK